jgi:hypothetical protein
MTDPIPAPLSGDPDTIQRFAQNYRDTANALRDAVSSLAELANENVTISLAVDEVREKATDAREATGKVATRYEGAADTYSAYRTSLADAQSRAEQARTAIDANNSSARYWRDRRRQLIAQSVLAPSEEILEDLTEANERVSGFAAEFTAAMAVYNQAVQDKADAVANAIAGLDAAADAAGLNDGFFEAISGALQQLYELAQTYLAPLIEQLREILEFIKSIVDVLSFIVTILAIFIPALGPIALALTVLSIALSAAIFLASVALFALGKESLGRVLSDGIGVVISIVTSKIGAGGAHAAGTAAQVPFTQVAAANGGVLRTVFAATAEVSEAASRDAVEELGQNAVNFALETTLDISIDQFPNSNGPVVGADPNVMQDGGMSWDFNNMTDPSHYGEFIIDQSLGVVAPGAEKVLNAVEQGFDVFGGEWSAPSTLWNFATPNVNAS